MYDAQKRLDEVRALDFETWREHKKQYTLDFEENKIN